MKKRFTALALAAVMALGTVAAAAGAEKTISVTPMSLNVNGQVVTPTKSDGATITSKAIKEAVTDALSQVK